MSEKMRISDLKKIYRSCDTFVVCSTQNQVVNYIPIINMLEAKQTKQGEEEKQEEVVETKEVKLFNITYKSNKKESSNEKKKSDNDKWNENLNNTLDASKQVKSSLDSGLIVKKDKILHDIFLNRGYDESEYKTGILDEILDDENHNTSNIIWNVTGGQRNVLLTILRIIKEERNVKHTIIYMEGNTNRLIVGQAGKDGEIQYIELDEIYGCKELTIEIVFGLSGFLINKKYNHIKLLENVKEPTLIQSCIKNLWKLYKDKEYGQILRTALLEVKTDQKNHELNKQRFKEAFNKINNKVKIKEKKLSEETIEELKEFKDDATYKFGYYLEEMTVYCLFEAIKEIQSEQKKEILKDYFLEIGYDIHLDSDNPEYDGRKDFCQFDVVLLTKAGQLIIFECKTGAIESKDAKERMYTAYAVGGVYGRPILIPVYLHDDEVENLADQNKAWKKVLETRNAATRAQMKIWRLDSLKKEINDLYEEAMNEYC